jgi:predicted PurR-regulated permease PerM
MEAAMYNLVLTFKQAAAESDWLSNVTAANWSQRVPESQRMVDLLFNQYEKMVKGQTGSSEAEDQLYDTLSALRDQLNNLVNNAPSWLQQAAAQTARFFSDFADGVTSMWQGSMDKMVSVAGPVLRKYYDAAVKAIVMRNELRSLQAAGQLTPEVVAQRTMELDQGDQLLNVVRSVYKRVSGGSDIDALAQQEFGSYPALSGPAAIVAIAIGAIAVSAISYLVIKASNFMDSLKPLTEQATSTIKQAQEVAKQAGEAVAEGRKTLATAATSASKIDDILVYVYWALGAATLGGVAFALYYFTKKD